MVHFTSFQVILVALGLLLVVSDAFPANEVYALTTFKEAVFEDPLMVLSNWNALDADPCDWTGVTCSDDEDHIIKLNISGSSIKGFIAAELFQLSALEELILHDNRLIGIIPKEIGSLKNLNVLDLGKNQLSGPIPPEVGNLVNVVRINLQSNGLTGSLPTELCSLKNLVELRLDRNKLEGTVPAGDTVSDFKSNMHGMYSSGGSPSGFCSSSQLKMADFSYNFLVGSIPKCLGYLPRYSFQGNCLQDKDTNPRSAQQCVDHKHQPVEEDRSKHQVNSKPSWIFALEIVTGVMVGTLMIGALFTAVQKFKYKSSIVIPWKKSTSKRNYSAIYIDTDMLKNVVRFSRQELEEACEDFSNIIGSSSDSVVYKGNMKGGPEIAVISLCIKEENWTGYLELYYQKEVADLARLNHENTGKLLGYCRESRPFTRMLVFEYASNGTLHEHLHYGEGCQINWTRRMKIIVGIAKGLNYLHTEVDPPFTISELNSNAVYLTEDFSPKLVDFESWKTIVSRSESNSRSISYEGAICVLPNSLEGRHLDIRGNIYSFGVLLLEIISGRPPFSEDRGCLVDWAKEYLESPEAMSKIVDPELKHFRSEDLEVICEVVNKCIYPKPFSQTSLQELCTMLESKIDTSVYSEIRASLAWAEIALDS